MVDLCRVVKWSSIQIVVWKLHWKKPVFGPKCTVFRWIWYSGVWYSDGYCIYNQLHYEFVNDGSIYFRRECNMKKTEAVKTDTIVQISILNSVLDNAFWRLFNDSCIIFSRFKAIWRSQSKRDKQARCQSKHQKNFTMKNSGSSGGSVVLYTLDLVQCSASLS